MTEETQALVERLKEEGESRIDHRAGDYAGELLLDAAAALASLSRENEQHKRLLLDIMAEATMAIADAAIVADTFNGQHILDAVTRLSRDLETARQERDAAQSNYDGACRTIALMHEAATGRSGEGPHLGVVEDVAAAVRAARAETWAEAAAWHEGMAESSVIPSLRPLHQQYSANFRERARLAAREEQ